MPTLEALEEGQRVSLDAKTAELLRSQTERLARQPEDIGTVSPSRGGRRVPQDGAVVQPASMVTSLCRGILVIEAYYKAKGVLPRPGCRHRHAGAFPLIQNELGDRYWPTCWTTRPAEYPAQVEQS